MKKRHTIREDTRKIERKITKERKRQQAAYLRGWEDRCTHIIDKCIDIWRKCVKSSSLMVAWLLVLMSSAQEAVCVKVQMGLQLLWRQGYYRLTIYHCLFCFLSGWFMFRSSSLIVLEPTSPSSLAASLAWRTTQSQVHNKIQKRSLWMRISCLMCTFALWSTRSAK